MKKPSLIFLLCLGATFCLGQNPVNRGVMERVFAIQFQGHTGTGFVISVDSGDYLISARHLFVGANDKSKVDVGIVKDMKYYIMSGILHLHKKPDIDIAVV